MTTNQPKKPLSLRAFAANYSVKQDLPPNRQTAKPLHPLTLFPTNYPQNTPDRPQNYR
jgi:hypothetical protein